MSAERVEAILAEVEAVFALHGDPIPFSHSSASQPFEFWVRCQFEGGACDYESPRSADRDAAYVAHRQHLARAVAALVAAETDGLAERTGDRSAWRECVHGTEGACLSIRCGSNCWTDYDRMHPCLACTTLELRRLRDIVGWNPQPAETDGLAERVAAHLDELKGCPHVHCRMTRSALAQPAPSEGSEPGDER